MEKAYDRVDWLALWEVLRTYGVGGKLLIAIKSFYEAASACVKTESEGDLQRVVNEFYTVCKRRKLKVNAGKSKVKVVGANDKM